MNTFLWMSGALISFSLLAVGARELSTDINTFQALFFRSLIGLAIISAIILSKKQTALFKSNETKMHIFRNIFHFAGQYGWFIGIALLPLAEVFALEFTVPLWTALIAAIFLNEKITLKKSIALLMGMLGVVIIIKPGLEIIKPAALIVLAAAVCYAISHTSTKSLSTTEKPLTILFYMCLIQLPIGFILSFDQWEQTPLSSISTLSWAWIIVISTTAMSAHYCLTKAMQYNEVGTVMAIDFLRLPLIALVGILLYQENFDISLILGAILMLAGNSLNFYSPARQASTK